MSSSLSKNLETEINVFKSNYQIIKNKKYYEISTLYECVKNYRWLLVAISQWFVWQYIDIVTIQVECCNVLCMDAKLFSLSRFNNFLLIDATDRSKISNDQKRIFCLNFFANTPFKFKDMGVKLVLLSKIYSFNDIINNLAKKI